MLMEDQILKIEDIYVPVKRDQLGEQAGLTRSGHSLDYGVQKVCVPKTSEAVEKLRR